MPEPRAASRSSSIARTDRVAGAQNAALLGATTAFGRPAPKVSSTISSYVGANGALTAAATVGTRSKTPSPNNEPVRLPVPAPAQSPASPTENVKGAKSRSTGSGEGDTRRRAASDLAPPSRPRRGFSKSPSQMAASVATIRAPPVRPFDSDARTSKRPAVAPKPRRLSQDHGHTVGLETRAHTDGTSIAPTTSLVDMFERKGRGMQSNRKGPQPLVIRPTEDLAIKSPKPLRAPGGITSVFQMELEGRVDPRNTIEDPEPSFSKASGQERGSSSDSYASASEDMPIPSSPIPIVKRSPTSPVSSSSVAAKSPNTITKRAGPSPSPLRQSVTHPDPVAADCQPLARSATLPAFSPSPGSAKSIPAQYHQLHPRRVTPLSTGDQLANAIVASSLASSRASSPRKPEPPPPPSRRQKHHHHLPFARTPSPAKPGLRHTLRKLDTDSSEDEDEPHPFGKHKRKPLVRKHPNKHHEGDRKRWRDAVTERERKRYEGVWAANKGIHNSFAVEEQQKFNRAPNSPRNLAVRENVSDQVSNIITRDIWTRSRLPEHTLETVWDLVDSDGVGRLGKAEFVVGMWLIDQRLKGRKLPVRVSETVWASVRGTQGIKIRK